MLSSSCALDRRELSSSSLGGAPDDADSQAQAGAPDDAPTSGAGAGGEESSGLVAGCADLDTDGVPDCTTTLVRNPTFSEDVSDWSVDGGAELSWDSKNALSDQPSGSAKLRASAPRASAWQCVGVGSRELVIAYASALVEDPTELGRAELETSFFDTDDCSGERTGYFKTPTSSVVNGWTTLQAGGVSLEGTRSATIALVAVKPDGATELDVYFDNVMFKTKSL